MNTNNITKLETELADLNKTQSLLRKQIYEAKKAQVAAVDKAAVRKAEKVKRYATTNGLTIHKLRLAGNTVKVTHIRYTTADVTYGQTNQPNYEVHLPVPSYLRGLYTFNSKGGATYIVITTPAGQKFSVSSACHELDSFDYKKGVKLALDQFTEIEARLLLNPAPIEAPEPVEV